MDSSHTCIPIFFRSYRWGFRGSTHALCWYHYNYGKDTAVTYALGWGDSFYLLSPVKGQLFRE